MKENQKSERISDDDIRSAAEKIAQKALKEFPKAHYRYFEEDEIKDKISFYPEVLKFSSEVRDKVAKKAFKNFDSEKSGGYLLRMKLMECMFSEDTSLLFDECFIKKHREKLEISDWDMVIFFHDVLIEHYLKQKKFDEGMMNDCKNKTDEDGEAVFKKSFAVTKWIFAATIVESRRGSEEYYPGSIEIDFSRHIDVQDLCEQEQNKILKIVCDNVSFYKNQNLEAQYRDIMLDKLIANGLTDEDTIKMYEEVCAQANDRVAHKRKCSIL